MKYYIFKVLNSLGQEYFILNNKYIGYMGFDSNRLRSILEYNNGVTKKYQLYASGIISDDEDLHKLNCESTRFSKEEIEALIKEYNGEFKLSKDKSWYKVYYPNKNSSESYLKEIDKNDNFIQLGKEIL